MVVKRGLGKDPFKTLMKHSRKKLYIALDNLNMKWTKDEIQMLFELWTSGWSLSYISQQLDRDVDEIAVLMIDLSSRQTEYIIQRRYGINISPEVEVPWFLRRSVNQLLKSFDQYYSCFETSLKVDFIWDEVVVLKFDELWEQGFSIQKISKKLKRNVIEVALLVIDRARKEFIKPRNGGLVGDEYDSKKIL